jgi:hypothetical protein
MGEIPRVDVEVVGLLTIIGLLVGIVGLLQAIKVWFPLTDGKPSMPVKLVALIAGATTIVLLSLLANIATRALSRLGGPGSSLYCSADSKSTATACKQVEILPASLPGSHHRRTNERLSHILCDNSPQNTV